MISARALISIFCIVAGFLNSCRAFDLIEEDPVFSALYFSLAAGWMFIVARQMTANK